MFVLHSHPGTELLKTWKSLEESNKGVFVVNEMTLDPI